jgi:hypothetical protein
MIRSKSHRSKNQNHSCKYMRRKFLFGFTPDCPVDCNFSSYLQHNNILSRINFGLRNGNFQQRNKRANQKDVREELINLYECAVKFPATRCIQSCEIRIWDNGMVILLGYLWLPILRFLLHARQCARGLRGRSVRG